MKVLFYSDRCKFSKEIILKLKESKFSNEFKLINIDNSKVPSKIKVVPTIIDPEYKDILEGKKAFEYLFNKKYFDNPTNNFYLWKDKNIPRPSIEEDKLAIRQNEDLLESQKITIENNLENKKEEPKNEPKKKIKISKRNLLLIRGRSS